MAPPPKPTASFSDVPTNIFILRKAMIIVFLLLVNKAVNKAELRVFSSENVHLLPHHPLSISDYTLSEIVFTGSDLVNTVSLIIVLVIVMELARKWSDEDEARRPINLHYLAWIRAVFVSTILLAGLRLMIRVHSHFKALFYCEIPFFCALLMELLGICWLFWSSPCLEEKEVEEVFVSP